MAGTGFDPWAKVDKSMGANRATAGYATHARQANLVVNLEDMEPPRRP